MSNYSNACTVTQLKAEFSIYQDQKTNIQYALYYETTTQQSIAYADTTYPGSTHNRTITKSISKTPYNFINDSIIQVAIGQNTPTFWGSQLTANVTVTATYTPGCYVDWYPRDPSGNTNNWQDLYPKNGSNNITFQSLTATGYHFDGWYTGATSGQGTKTTSATASVYDLNYHGEWTKWYKVIFYNQNGTAISTKTQQILDATGTSLTPDSSLNPSMNGYTFQGWTRTPDNGKNYKIIYTNTSYSVDNIVDNQINGVATAGGFEIKYYPVFKKEYQIIFNKILPDATFSYTQSNYNNKIVGGTVTTPTAPIINTHKFIGWSRDSSVTAATAVLSGTNQNCWTTIPAVADSQVNGEATANGFEIIYYAVWQNRDSITIGQVLPNFQVTEPAIITVTGAAASDNNTYYFNPNSNISFSVAIKQEHEIYFIDSVTANTTTDLITNGSLTADRKTYTSGQITAGTNATAITITIVYIEGLPIFYPSGENDFKRAMYAYWENTRAIGLYYENTRLL